MSEIRFRGDITVRLVRQWGSDADIVGDAQVRRPHDPVDPDRVRPILRSMLGRKVVHTSPFEHSGMSVHVEGPAVIWWEWTRHRFMPQSRADHSFNLESARYKVLRPEFYLPPAGRPIREPDGFKPMRPNHETDPSLTALAHAVQRPVFEAAWDAYEWQLARGIAREVARNVLGPAIYYSGRVSGGVLTWLHFFALRTRDHPAKPSSYPQWEIEQAARQCEEEFTRLFPVTHEIFNEFGRVAP
jgi:thymidylate synthase (FAD)